MSRFPYHIKILAGICCKTGIANMKRLGLFVLKTELIYESSNRFFWLVGGTDKNDRLIRKLEVSASSFFNFKKNDTADLGHFTRDARIVT